MFANQFKGLTQVKLRVFILKVEGFYPKSKIKGFYPETDLTHGTVPGAPRLDKTFFGLYLYLVGKYCENPKLPGPQLNVNPARAITWFEGVTIYCTFFKYNLPPPRQFLCNKILLKKISDSKGNAH